MSEITEYFPSGGTLPGFSGDHAPGVYLVDYEARTIRLASSTNGPQEPLMEAPLENLKPIEQST